jgi:hypothetical protein
MQEDRATGVPALERQANKYLKTNKNNWLKTGAAPGSGRYCVFQEGLPFGDLII